FLIFCVSIVRLLSFFFCCIFSFSCCDHRYLHSFPTRRSSDLFLMSSLMLLLVWLIFFMVLIKLLPILGTISGKTVKLMVLATALDRKSGSAGMPRPISYAVFCLKKKI